MLVHLSLQKLVSLKEKYPNCIFHRVGNEIFCLPLNKGEVFGQERTINVETNHGIIRRLISECLLRKLVKTHCVITKFPNTFIDTSKNILDDMV